MQDVGLGRTPDFRREREYRFIDEYFNRLGAVIVDGDLRAGSARLVELACAALGAAGFRCARTRRADGRFSRAARRTARRLMKDERTREALRDKFEGVGLDGRLIANRLKTIIESEDEETALKAIDIAIKVTGDYAPTRVDQRNLNANLSGNIFAGPTAFMDRVGKPDVSGVLPPAPDITPLEQELTHGEAQPRREHVRQHRDHDPFKRLGDESARRDRNDDRDDRRE